MILEKILHLPVPSEGDLSCLVYLIEHIKVHCTDSEKEKTAVFLERYHHVINSEKYTMNTRILSAYLMIEISLSLKDNHATWRALDAIQEILSTTEDLSTRKKMYIISSRAFAKKDVGEKHGLLTILTKIAKVDLRSKYPTKRKHAMDLYKIFSTNWESDQCTHFLFRLLADSDHEVIDILMLDSGNDAGCNCNSYTGRSRYASHPSS